MSLRPFHLAIPVDDLEAARAFYGGALACPEGRSAERWVDFDLYGPPAGGAPGRRDGGGRPTWSTATACRCRTSAWC